MLRNFLAEVACARRGVDVENFDQVAVGPDVDFVQNLSRLVLNRLHFHVMWRATARSVAVGLNFISNSV